MDAGNVLIMSKQLYAGEIQNLSQGDSTSLLMEVTCHHFAQLDDETSFSFEVGLVNGSKASKRIQKILVEQLELDPDSEAAASIKCGLESRFNPLASCHKGDVVLYNDSEGLKAGKVQLHFEVHGLPISMVNVFEPRGRDPHNNTSSMWKPTDINICIETNMILASAVYSLLPNGNALVLVPLELR